MDALGKIRNWMLENKYDGIVLSRRDNYMWLMNGHENHVLESTEYGVGFLVIKKDLVTIFSDSCDAKRLEEEQNPIGANVVLVPWYESMEEAIHTFLGNGVFGSDSGFLFKNIQSSLVDLRMQLTKQEVEDYKEIGLCCANIVESVCREAKPSQTEHEIANEVRRKCFANDIHPNCVLVGCDERILKYRHPMPTDKKIQNSLMVVLGGEKKGLNVSITRFVYFSLIPDDIKEKYKKNQMIFAAMQLLMKDGMPYRDYFSKVQELYQELGYPKEWTLHHQGGPTGYACREMVINPNSEGILKANQAYAWNPTITGAKCEETTYFSKDGVITLTRTKDWPVREVITPYGIFEVAEILQK